MIANMTNLYLSSKIIKVEQDDKRKSHLKFLEKTFLQILHFLKCDLKKCVCTNLFKKKTFPVASIYSVVILTKVVLNNYFY